ncbi:MAG: Rrf2 family transcriptional regulator [Helicobacteraceae bacterium]|jgi:Rrf2 family protein|nr:Rrf2 family transcriptional regulator [Helicobacteraceae bacterium]
METPIFSKTAQYAFRIVIFMSNDTERLFSAAYIHEKIDIPYKYLAMLMTKLAKSDLLEVTRGRNGGFLLSREVSEIYLIDVLDAIKENNCTNCAFTESDCDELNPCSLHDVYKVPKQALVDMLTTTTLANIDPKLI